MSEELVAWSSWEEIGIGIPNPGSCVEITGDPEFLEALNLILENEHPDWVYQDGEKKNITSIIMNSDQFKIFRLDHPEIFNNQAKKLKLKFIANDN